MLHTADAIAILTGALPGALLAYIGPGAGLGGLAIAIALILGAVFLLIGLVWYPMKRVLRNRSGGPATVDRPDDAE